MYHPNQIPQVQAPGHSPIGPHGMAFLHNQCILSLSVPGTDSNRDPYVVVRAPQQRSLRKGLGAQTLHTEVAYSASGKTLKRRKTASRCPNKTSCRPSRSTEGILVSQWSFQEGSRPCHKSLFSAAFSHTTGWERCRICVNVSCIFLSGVCTVHPGTAVPAISPKVPYS